MLIEVYFSLSWTTFEQSLWSFMKVDEIRGLEDSGNTLVQPFACGKTLSIRKG